MVNFGLSGLPHKVVRLTDKVANKLRQFGVLRSGGRLLIKLDPRVPNKFVIPGLSRMNLRDGGLFESPAVPAFDANGFEKNLENILNTVKDHRELTDRIADALGTFIWKPDWTTLVVNHPLTGKEIVIPGRQFPSFDQKDIELARPNSIVDFAVKNRRLVYVPDYRFEVGPFKHDSIYYIPVPEGLEAGESIATTATREKLNVMPYIKAFEAAEQRKEDVPVTVVITPILWLPEKKTLGYFMAAYAELMVFGGSEKENKEENISQELRQDKLRYFYSISQAAALKLQEFQKQGKIPQ